MFHQSHCFTITQYQRSIYTGMMYSLKEKAFNKIDDGFDDIAIYKSVKSNDSMNLVV